MEDADDASALLRSLVAGDEDALAEVYARWSPLVYSVGVRSLATVAEAEELTQRVFTDAWTRRHTVDPSETSLPAWLLQLTRDRLAESAPVVAGGGPGRSPGDGAADAVGPDELADRLVLADELAHLAAVPQEVVRLALRDGGVPSAQIAAQLGLPDELVKSHLRRSLLRLRQRLAVIHDAH